MIMTNITIYSNNYMNDYQEKKIQGAAEGGYGLVML